MNIYKILSLPYSFIIKIIYRMKGYNIGKNCRFMYGSHIGADKVTIGNDFYIGLFSKIKAKENLVIGNKVQILNNTEIDVSRVYIGDETHILDHVIIGDSMSNYYDCYFKIGKRSLICRECYINCAQPVEIGDDTGIGHFTKMFTHGFWNKLNEGYPWDLGKIKIGNNVWVSTHILIMPSVSIGDNSIIGAGAVIVKDIPENSLAAGVPAKVIKESRKQLAEEDEIKIIKTAIERAINRRSDESFKKRLEKCLRDMRAGFSVSDI